MDRGAWWATVLKVAKSRTGLRDQTGPTCNDEHKRYHADGQMGATGNSQKALKLRV